jgi:PAS domain S-box-containing protein
VSPWFGRVRERLPNEAWPLGLLRALVIVASFVWLALVTPDQAAEPRLVAVVLGAFAAYGVVLLVLLWRRTAAVLRWNFPVLVLDLGFALTVIFLTGGIHSVFFLAFYLIVALQAYYYGTQRGVGVAVAAAVLYLIVVWPTLAPTAWDDLVLYEGMLLLTAVGLGVVGRLQREERLEILALNEALASRDRFVQDMLASLRDGVVTLDPGRRVTGWNAAMERRCGIRADRAVGRLLSEVLPAVVREGLAGRIAELFAGTRDRFELDRFAVDTARAGRVVLTVKASAIRDAHGTFRGAILFVEDLTERLSLEESLRQAEKLAAIGTLAAGVAHEINNPIGIIASRSELILEDAERNALPPEVRRDLAVIRAHAERIGRTTQSLLAFARQRPAEKVAVDLNRFVRDALRPAERELRARRVRLAVELGPDLPRVHADPAQLSQVLANLLTNARDAVGEGGEILVRTGLDPEGPGGVRLVVRDTGVGIPEEHLGRIFEPFFTTKPTGAGLGLAMCYGIIRDHGGSIAVESRPGQGTIFVLSLPRHPADGTTERA